MTVPEAGILLGIPLHQIVTLIVIGMIRKDILNIVNVNPLEFKRNTPYPKLQKYEVFFLSNCLTKLKGHYIVDNQVNIEILLVQMIKEVNKKNEGIFEKRFGILL